MAFYLENLQNVSRKRKSKNWLEPTNGVGSAAARRSVGSGASTGWCTVCGTGLAVCLGASCMGKKPISEKIVSETSRLSSGPFSFPGYCSDSAVNQTLKARQFTDKPKTKISALRFPCFSMAP